LQINDKPSNCMKSNEMPQA